MRGDVYGSTLDGAGGAERAARDHANCVGAGVCLYELSVIVEKDVCKLICHMTAIERNAIVRADHLVLKVRYDIRYPKINIRTGLYSLATCILQNVYCV